MSLAGLVRMDIDKQFDKNCYHAVNKNAIYQYGEILWQNKEKPVKKSLLQLQKS